MKKLLFSAMACIAFAGSAFASNEVVNENHHLENEISENDSVLAIESDEKRPCSFKAAFVGRDGKVVIKEGNTEEMVTKVGCKEAADAWAAATHQITPFIPGSLDTVWGDRL